MSKRKNGYSYWNIFLSTLVADIMFASCTIFAITDLLASHGGAWHQFGAVCWIVFGKVSINAATAGRIDAEIERAFRVRGLDKDDY